MVKKGKGFFGDMTKKLLKGTRIISKMIKMSGRVGSPVYKFGESMHQRGYGQHQLTGRLFLN